LVYCYFGAVALLLFNLSGMENIERSVVVVSEKVVKKNAGRFGHILHSKEFVCILVAFFLINVATQPVVVYLINIIRELGGSEASLGWANFILMGVEFPIMMISGFLMKKISSRRLMLISILLNVIRAIIYLVSRNLLVLFFGLAIQAVAGGLHGTASVYYINEVMSQEDGVSGQSVYYMLAVVFAGGLGNIIGGKILDYYGVRGMLIIVVIMSVLGCLIAINGLVNKQKVHKGSEDE